MCKGSTVTDGGRIGAGDGDVVRVTAVVGTLTPRAVATVQQRRLAAITTQTVQPHAAMARAEVVADGVTVFATVTTSLPSIHHQRLPHHVSRVSWRANC